MMRTQEEILRRVKKIEKRDLLRFETNDLLGYLEHESVKPFLKKEARDKPWKPEKQKDVKKIMIEYMGFAWEKANNCRGISSSRSMSHYRAWLWIDGSPEALKIIPAADYEHYGKNELCKICNYLKLDSKQWDDGVRCNTEPY